MVQYLTKVILQLPSRKKTAHKGDYGRVLVIAGSEDYPGAAALATSAALAVLRSGADLVTVMAPEKVAWAINCLIPDVITKKLNGTHFKQQHAKQVISFSQSFDVVLIGPGIGKKSDSFLRTVCKAISKPKVIDADAIKAVQIQKVNNTIFTPHQKEYEALLHNSKLHGSLRKALGSNVILLKGPIDVIMSKSKAAYNKTGNPVMAKGGTGDVLAGLCTGFLAQMKQDKAGFDLFKAACMAAYLNGAVGDYLIKKRGRTFIASDIVENLHAVWK